MTTRRRAASRRLTDDTGALIAERLAGNPGAFEGAPTPERAAKNEIEAREQRHGQRPGTRVRDTLAMLEKQGYTDAAGRDAGEKFRELREIAAGVRSGDNAGVRAPHWMAAGPSASMIDAEHAIRLVKRALPVPTWMIVEMIADNRSLNAMGHALGCAPGVAGTMSGRALGELAGFWAQPKTRQKITS